ncbi:MAG: hypothetical protein IJU28_08180, partial [Clostridia bacterium]|nr:hypothetical protein [Clostridia bacterium]
LPAVKAISPKARRRRLHPSPPQTSSWRLLARHYGEKPNISVAAAPAPPHFAEYCPYTCLSNKNKSQPRIPNLQSGFT